MDDKTLVVTIALAARYREVDGVVAGTLLGMMAANIPVIYLDNKFTDRLSIKAVHIVAAIIFFVVDGLAPRTALYSAVPSRNGLFVR